MTDQCYGTALAECEGVISARALIVGLVGAGCVAAAGAGGYLAVRSSSQASAAEPSTTVWPAGPPSAVGFEAQQPPQLRLADGRTTRQATPDRGIPKRDQAPPAAPGPSQAPTVAEGPVAGPVVSPSSEQVRGPAEGDDVGQVGQPPAQDPGVAPLETDKVVFDELTLHADAVIGIRLSSTISSATARVEDRVSAQVVRDVTVDGRVVVPAGATAEGEVTLVQRGGKFKERSRLGVRFTAIVLTGNVRVPVQTDTILRAGESPTGRAAAKVGAGAVIGAIIGRAIGGKKGAAIGSTAGATGGTAAVMAGDANEAILVEGSTLTVRLSGPATILVERQP